MRSTASQARERRFRANTTHAQHFVVFVFPTAPLFRSTPALAYLAQSVARPPDTPAPRLPPRFAFASRWLARNVVFVKFLVLLCLAKRSDKYFFVNENWLLSFSNNQISAQTRYYLLGIAWRGGRIRLSTLCLTFRSSKVRATAPGLSGLKPTFSFFCVRGFCWKSPLLRLFGRLWAIA